MCLIRLKNLIGNFFGGRKKEVKDSIPLLGILSIGIKNREV